MELIDKRKLDTAIEYFKRITEGNNPINNLPLNEDDVLNNPNMIRCAFFVKDVLEAVKSNGYSIKSKSKVKREPFPLEYLSNYSYRSDCAISQFVNQLNEPIDATTYRKLSYKCILDWLRSNNFLIKKFDDKLNREVTLPTEKGIGIGINSELRSRQNGEEYIIIIYGRQAQEFIIQNIELMLPE